MLTSNIGGIGAGEAYQPLASQKNKAVKSSYSKASEEVAKQDTNATDWVNFIYKISDGYSLHTKYDETSTDENPVMYVEMKDKNGNLTTLKVDINKIDPENATRAEMFALTTHNYKSDGEKLFNATIGYSYHEGLSAFNNLDGYKGLGDNILNSVLEDRINFVDLYKDISNIFFKAQDIGSYGRINDMISMFTQYPR